MDFSTSQSFSDVNFRQIECCDVRALQGNEDDELFSTEIDDDDDVDDTRTRRKEAQEEEEASEDEVDDEEGDIVEQLEAEEKRRS